MAMALPLLANNIQVGTVTVTDINTSGHYANLQFDISWDNSWRISTGPSNWNAAWVFAKWKLTNDTDWAHCTLHTSGHTEPTGFTIDAATDGTGIFIYRSADGSGSADWNNAKLRWNYGTDGIADDANVDVKIFAIEMVYIPQGSFSLYNGESADLTSNFNSGNTISSEDALVEGAITWNVSESNNSGAQNSDGSIGGCAALGANYPKGYMAIYCMKYEISQVQYANFLSLLTDAQDDNRYPDKYNFFRHMISGSYENYTADVPNRACNCIGWADALAYADWAGLRPMTELEYEKICRGPETADTDYAWGSTAISGLETGTGNRVQNDGLPNASSTSSSDNCHYNNSGGAFDGGGPYGPVRCGLFAETGTNRESSGATYYGVMDMSGNLWEGCITVAKYCYGGTCYPYTWNNETGAGSFDGQHGDGSLTVTGFADVTNWPSPTATVSKTSYGASFRGGDWVNDGSTVTTRMRVSNRGYAGSSHSARGVDYGFHCVRKSP